jgi:hypothetical protein
VNGFAQVDGESASDIAGGASVGGVHVEADGRLTSAINRRGTTPTVGRTGPGVYTANVAVSPRIAASR